MKRFVAALFNSLAGIRFGFMHESALRQELALFALSLAVAPLLTLDPWKLVALWGSLMLVLAVEFLNTGLEKLADRVTRQDDPLIGVAKDCGSAAVLMSLTLAGLIWALALWERLAG
ncbi:MAG: diacylglycerol kinase [Alphaproteobacteria bacterium]|nr:MAG: diacylglycerol kinase [Alphaproteobacteria bacterium]